MCVTCGCGRPGESHEHSRAHAVQPSTDLLAIEERVLAHNDHVAAHNRAWLGRRGIRAVNLMSSPGSGKTSLLERTIAETSGRREVCVIEGDQETAADAERIARAGAGCHLDASMVERALGALDPGDGSLLFVENVGNLVCPALFDVGEHRRVVVVSVTEGDDKPLKYPQMFAAADLVVVNKTDLLPYVDCDLDVVTKNARAVHPGVDVLPLSVRDGSGMDAWYAWLDRIGDNH